LIFAFEVVASADSVPDPDAAAASLLNTKAKSNAKASSAAPKEMLRTAERFRGDENIRFLPLGEPVAPARAGRFYNGTLRYFGAQ
jgi:hypothetical protein